MGNKHSVTLESFGYVYTVIVVAIAMLAFIYAGLQNVVLGFAIAGIAHLLIYRYSKKVTPN